MHVGDDTSRTRVIWRRRRAALVAAACLALAALATACGSDDSESGDKSSAGKSDAPVQITVAQIPGALSLWLSDFAQDAGIYKKHGIQYKTVTVKAGTEIAAALASGAADAGSLPPTILVPAINSGARAKYVLTSWILDWSIIARKGVPLPNADAGYPKSMRDLKGLRVGVGALGGAAQKTIEKGAKAGGLDPSEMSFVAIGGGGSSAAAFKNAQVDAMALNPPLQYVVGTGNFTTVADTRDIEGPKYIYNSWALSDSLINDADRAKRFCDSLKDAAAFAKDPANVDAVVASLSKRLSITVPQAKELWGEYKDRVDVGPISKERWDSQTIPDLTPYDKSVSDVCGR